MKNTFRTSFFAKACAAAMCVTLAACGGGAATSDQADTSATEQTTAEATDTTEATDASTTSDAVMSYAEYAAAAVDDPVTIEAYVQGKQSWWDNKATLYLQDEDGAYFVYNAECSEADYDKLVEGQKVRVEGYKTEWSGEVEVAEGAKLEVVDGNWIAEPVDITDKLDAEDLIDHQNQKVSFTGLTIAASEDADGNEVAFTYGADGSGAQGDDLYFKVSDGTDVHTFTVESYLCDKDSDVYKAVEGLNVGDTVDLEGFLYWYEGANPHITSVTVK
jgi:hypothetical protein